MKDRWLIFFLLLVSVPQVFFLPLWVTGLWGGVLIYAVIRKGRKKWWDSIVIILIMVALVAGIIGDIGWNTLGAVRAFLVVALWVRYLEAGGGRRGSRGFSLLFLMAVVLVALVSVESRHGVILLLDMAVILLGLYLVSEQRKRAFRRFMLPVILTLPLMLALFLFFPRINGNLLDIGFMMGLPVLVQTQEERDTEPLKERLEFGNISKRSSSGGKVLMAHFPNGLPDMDQLYWRGPVLWTFDGKGWNTRDGWEKRSVRMQGKLRQAALEKSFSHRGDPLDYHVTLMPSEGHWLYALDVVGSVVASSYVTRDHQLMNMNPIFQPLGLDLRSYPDGAVGYELNDGDRALALAYEVAGNDRTRALILEWQQTGVDKKEIVGRGVRLMADGYHYTSKSPPLVETGGIDQFLFDDKTGHAYHFATSFALMMRMADIPTRLVAGYRGGTPIALTDYVMVLQSNAHIWTEVWLEKEGWQRVDPAAPYVRVNKAVQNNQSFFYSSREDKKTVGIEKEKASPQEKVANKEPQPTSWNFLDNLMKMQSWLVAYDGAEQGRKMTQVTGEKSGWYQFIILTVISLSLLVLIIVFYILFGDRMTRRIKNWFYPKSAMDIFNILKVVLTGKGITLDERAGPIQIFERIRRDKTLNIDVKIDIKLFLEAFVTLQYGSCSTLNLKGKNNIEQRKYQLT
ncbi:MAG: DUF3488 domain-containing transglutaminase family protein, partial [Emcibacter sp.]|nr:DUF3488 domain-containing transglutaminase family protein [Emcibacter sp.]